jgi:hypothetical protein
MEQGKVDSAHFFSLSMNCESFCQIRTMPMNCPEVVS